MQGVDDRQQRRRQILDALQTEGTVSNELAERIIDQIRVHPDKRIEIIYKIADLFD